MATNAATITPIRGRPGLACGAAEPVVSSSAPAGMARSGCTPARVGISSTDATATAPNSHGYRAAPSQPISAGPTTAPTPKCALSRFSMAALRRPNPMANRWLSP